MNSLQLARDVSLVRKSLKTRVVSDSALVASPLGEGERIEVRGRTCRCAAVVLTQTLTFPLSLAKGEATGVGLHVIPALKITPNVLGNLNMTRHL
jgi:hypothetical protein